MHYGWRDGQCARITWTKSGRIVRFADSIADAVALAVQRVLRGRGDLLRDG